MIPRKIPSTRSKRPSARELLERAQFEAGVDVEPIEGDRAEEILRTDFDVLPRVRGAKVIALRSAFRGYSAWAAA